MSWKLTTAEKRAVKETMKMGLRIYRQLPEHRRGSFILNWRGGVREMISQLPLCRRQVATDRRIKRIERRLKR